jgi:amino acid transporter
MVGYTAVLIGYVAGQFWPETFSASIPSPLLMIIVSVVFSLFIGYISYRGVNLSTAVNVIINVIQISVLLIFSVVAIGYRANHGEGSVGYTMDPDGVPTQYVIDTKDDKPIKDEKTGEWVVKKNEQGKPEQVILEYKGHGISQEPVDKEKPDGDKQDTFNFHETAGSVVAPHNFSYIIIQACVAILILVGFESVTAMGEEAKNAKRDIPRAVLLSLFVQGVLCYFIGYFGSCYFLNPGDTVPTAGGSSAPLGDMCYICGTWLFGNPAAGKIMMLVMAGSVFLALVGTTLSCINTGARVTYAMGRDDEVPAHFGLLHGKNLTPHRAIWTLVLVSIVVAFFSVYFYFCGGAAQKDSDIEALPKNIWYSFGLWRNSTASQLPQGILVVALASNFGTFLLYMLTNAVAIEAFREHHTFSGFKHLVVPVFGLVANLLCMLFYLIGPFTVAGMSWKEPYAALAISVLWGAYGWWYFSVSGKRKALKATSAPARGLAASQSL